MSDKYEIVFVFVLLRCVLFCDLESSSSGGVDCGARRVNFLFGDGSLLAFSHL